MKKRGIDDSSKFTQEEAETFDRWNTILSEGQITVDKIKSFCDAQISIIEDQFENLENTDKKNERLILLHNVYKNFLKIINSPEAERENLEKYINSLLTTE